MPKKVIKGSGITARTVTVYEGEEIIEHLERQAKAPYMEPFEETIADVERWARGVLDPARAEGRLFSRDDDSPESYAFRAIDYIGMIRHCIKEPHGASNAAKFGVLLGQLLGEGRLKFMIEPAALVGIKASENLRSGQPKGTKAIKERAATVREQWREAARDLPKNPRFKDYTPEQVIAYIQKQWYGKMKSGKPYAARTIGDEIKGTR